MQLDWRFEIVLAHLARYELARYRYARDNITSSGCMQN